jgi:hypothetical protein
VGDGESIEEKHREQFFSVYCTIMIGVEQESIKKNIQENNSLFLSFYFCGCARKKPQQAEQSFFTDLKGAG